MTWKALNYFEQGEFSAAEKVYREILQAFPNDPVAEAMLRSISPNLQPEMSPG
jgi:TolA-binding protein